MSHYDALGVARQASADEVRSAYRRAARAAHPDRHGEASASRMAEVNEAWRVLGDPVRRQRYDLELDEATRRATGSAAGSATGSAVRSAGPPASREQTMPMPTGDMSRFPWRLFAILFVVGVVVVFVGNTFTDPPPPAPVDNLLLPGECVVFGDQVDEIVPTACDGPHDGVVVTVVPDAAQCPTGTLDRRDPLRGDRACLEAPAFSGG